MISKLSSLADKVNAMNTRIITDYLEQTAERLPKKRAIVDAAVELDFQTLRNWARRIATSLARRKLFHQPIVVFLDQSAASVVSFLGVAYAGNFYTVIDAKMPASRREKILATLQPAVIITDEKHHGAIAKDAGKAEILLYDELLQGVSDDALLAAIATRITAKDILYVLFTSGSTGMPKGVVIGQQSVMDYTEWVAETFHVDENDVIGNQAPFYFDNSVLDIYQMLRCGATLDIIPRSAFIFPVRLLEYVRDHGINMVFWVPSVLCTVANFGILDKVDITGLKKVLFAGEVMPNKQLNAWRRCLPDALFANLYGPTEITVDCTYYCVNRVFCDDEPLPIGVPCRPNTILILNEKNELITDTEQGELCVRGRSLAYGYYKNPEKTAESFVQNPLTKEKDTIYRTGDLVHYNERGEIMYDGRKDFQIKHMGHRIELGEIETAASSVTDVERVACIYDAAQDEILLCYTGKEEEQSLRSALRLLVPDYMMPRHIQHLDTMPLNANGKIDRKALHF